MLSRQNLNNAGGGMPVPICRDSGLSYPVNLTAYRIFNRLRLCPRNQVRSALNSDRSFCVLSHSDARSSQDRRFLLNPTGVRDDKSRMLHQREKLQIAEGIDQNKAVGQFGGASCIGFELRSVRPEQTLETEILHPLPGARMYGKYDRIFASQPFESP